MPPQVIVIVFFSTRFPETGDLDSLGVHTGHYVFDRTVFAGSIHALQDDQQRVGVLGPQFILETCKQLDPLCYTLLSLLFFGEITGISGIVILVKVQFPARRDKKRILKFFYPVFHNAQ